MKTTTTTLTILFSVVCLVILATGCSTNSYKAYTFAVNNGDSIKISLNTADNYDLSSELPFSISHDGQTLSQGTFIISEGYKQYVDSVESDENAKLLDSGEKNGNEYIFWCYDESEYNYAILIRDSNTAVLLGNIVSEESAKECFNRLTMTVEN